MAEHLGYECHAREGRGTPNSRKGSSPKRVKTEIGEIRETISKITDMAAWQNRPLDAVYPVLLIDAIVVEVRGALVANGPCTWRSAWISPANATCWACGWDPQEAKAPSSGPRCV